MYELPLAWSVPNWTDNRPFCKSAWEYPASVSEAVGLPAAVACMVKPVYPQFLGRRTRKC